MLVIDVDIAKLNSFMQIQLNNQFANRNAIRIGQHMKQLEAGLAVLRDWVMTFVHASEF